MGVSRDSFVMGQSPNTVWQPSQVSRQERLTGLGQQGATIWLTGLPASGKSTLAGSVERRLSDLGHLSYRLDGDNLRHGLNGDLGFAPSARTENVRRTAHAAGLLADAGVIVIVALVSPYVRDRETARTIHEQAELPFVEVYMDTPLGVCEERDPNGLYAKARRGELSHMTGIDDPYEPPPSPDLRITPGAAASRTGEVVELLIRLGLLTAPVPGPPAP